MRTGGFESALTALAVSLAMLGCGSPMTYPRTPDLHRGVSVALRSNVSHGDGEAKYSVRPGQTLGNGATTAEQLESPYEGHASGSSRSYNTWLRLPIGAVYSAEGNLAWGFSERTSLGGFGSLELIGAELRVQALSARDGGPLSATFALGGMHVGIFQSLSQDLLVGGWGGRAGLDLGLRVAGNELLVGGYASVIRRRRNFQKAPDDGLFRETPPGFYDGLMIVRDELKLSVPIGFAARGEGFALIFGVVPEWTLDARVGRASCFECAPEYQLDSFEQDFAIYFTVGGEGWRSSPQ